MTSVKLTLPSLSLSLRPFTEKVVDRHQPDRGGVALRGRGELHGEVLLPPAARLWSDLQETLDVLQAAVQGLQASPGLHQHPHTEGEGPQVVTDAHTLQGCLPSSSELLFRGVTASFLRAASWFNMQMKSELIHQLRAVH